MRKGKEIDVESSFGESEHFDAKFVKNYLLGMGDRLARAEKARLVMIIYRAGLMTLEEVKALGLTLKFLEEKND